MTLMGVGELGNFAAYGFAPASLIAPLGCVSVIGKCDLFFSFIHYPCISAGVKRVESTGNNRNHCHVKSIVLLPILSQTGIYVLTLLYMLTVWKLLLFCLTSDKNCNQYRMGGFCWDVSQQSFHTLQKRTEARLQLQAFCFISGRGTVIWIHSFEQASISAL